MKRRWIIELTLILICFGQMVTAAPRLSLTADEPVYIAAGYAYLHTGDLRLQSSVQHPPLVNVWEAWPLLLRPDTPDVNMIAGWGKAELSRFIIALLPQLGPIQATAFATRVPVMWLTLLLAVVVYRWAAERGGRIAGMVALGLFAFDPNLLAHGSLATTDLGVTALTFITMYGLMRFLQRPTWGVFFLVGVGLGLTMTAKTSGILLVVAIALIILASTRRLLRSTTCLAGLVAMACMVVWAVMGFELCAPDGWPIPLPAATYWLQVADFGHKSAGGQTAFLMGQLGQHGWWYYYPIAFALKTPLPTIILLVISLVWSIKSDKGKAEKGKWATLGVFPILYSIGALLSSFNTGYRFLLPVLPFLFVFIGVQISNFKFQIPDSRFQIPNSKQGKPVTWSLGHLVNWSPGHLVTWSLCLLVSALFVWYIFSAALTFPHYLAYFNETIGGADHGYKWLVDSNLDWGQEFIELGQYAQAHNITQIKVSQYTLVDAAMYGVNTIPIAPSRQAPPVFPARFDPAPGIYAISATTLQGVMMADPYNYEWFRHKQPAAKLGHALFVYDVPLRTQPPEWVAQCTQPTTPLTLQVIAEGFGRADLRLAFFDCTTSWLIPAGGRSPGWYALHRNVASAGDRFIKDQLDGMRLSYEQRMNQALPAFVMYEWNSAQTAPLAEMEKQAQAAPADWVPALSQTPSPSLTAPIQLDGPLTFLGYRLSSTEANDIVELWTIWQVYTTTTRPLSIMAHLIGSDGIPIAVGDGLGVPVEQWQNSDVIIQRHRLALPESAPPGTYWLQTGVYWLDTLERHSIASDQQAVSDRLILTTVEVKP